ncbi:NAD-dependent epimerase/dehydratase family protein [Halegenticoccus tardaugens]|uniref:NAD-dependent epimerase/dehydratase family protein n=1 Tax=Halegenticoccus tardaugens TaxID=2071624 RepID=UPI00100C3355|nr:NAD(P)-dependent oxidoreductase [Halegenticoccus tardaugens]
MTVVVIGASGYLGTYVVDELLARNYEVVGFDLAPSEALRSRASRTARLSVERENMRSFAALSNVLTTYDVEGIIQLAYYGTPEKGLLDSAETNPYEASNTNVEGFNNILEAARQFDIDSVVWASSTVVYGPPAFYEALAIDPVDEESPTAPESLYGACKVSNEYQASHYREQYDLDVAGIRLPLIYGPNRYPGAQPFIVELFNAAASGGTIALEDGDTTWDLLYERDIGPLFVEMFEADSFDNDVYNVYGHTVTVRELAKLAAAEAHEDATIEVREGADPVLPAPLDDSRFRHEFAFEPRYDATSAVSDYLQTLRKVGPE